MNISVRVIQTCIAAVLMIGCTASPRSTPALMPSPSPEPKSTSPIAATIESSLPLVAGQWNYLFYHPQLKQVVLVNGGPDRGKPASDPLELWAWDGKQWSLLSREPNGPTWRNFQAAAFDSKRNVLVMHGGVQDQNSRIQETWEWDGQTWSRFDVSGPGYREGAMMAYDAARGQSILFGGANEKFEVLGDTWAWDGAQWTQVSTTGPAPRFPSTIVYDGAREKVLLFSGHYVDQNSYEDFTDFWEWDGSSWNEIAILGEHPGARNISQMVFNPVNQNVLLFGGGIKEFLGDLWSWDGMSWSRLSESGGPLRSGAGGAYDPVRSRLVVFGGVEAPGGTAITDTWEWDGQNWICVHGCN